MCNPTSFNPLLSSEKNCIDLYFLLCIWYFLYFQNDNSETNESKAKKTVAGADVCDAPPSISSDANDADHKTTSTSKKRASIDDYFKSKSSTGDTSSTKRPKLSSEG